MELPNLDGKNAIVTGANTGIGRVTAVELARAGAEVWLACRSEPRTRPVLDEIEAAGGKAHFLALDLGDLASVRTAAERFLASDAPLHLLVNNAGLAGQRGLTRDGFELLFGVNHLGHFLFTLLLLDKLKASTPARIVNVASQAHYKCEGIDWDALRRPTRTITTMKEYAASKAANILFTRALARRLEGTGVTAHALHPGVVASDIWRKVPWPFRAIMKRRMLTNEEGAETTLYCATSPELEDVSGRYYDKCKERTPSQLVQDDALAETLWTKSAAWVGLSQEAEAERAGPESAPAGQRV